MCPCEYHMGKINHEVQMGVYPVNIVSALFENMSEDEALQFALKHYDALESALKKISIAGRAAIETALKRNQPDAVDADTLGTALTEFKAVFYETDVVASHTEISIDSFAQMLADMFVSEAVPA